MKIAVIGDIILDRYLHGSVTRENPEGLGYVFTVDREELRLGGAAAVARLIQGFGAQATLIGVVGDDQAGRDVIGLLDEHCLDAKVIVEPDRTTPLKERHVQSGINLPGRVDRERVAAIRPSTVRQLLAACDGLSCDAVLVSDYAKGCITQAISGALPGPMLIDPGRGVPWSKYPNRAVIKANLSEARGEAGKQKDPWELCDLRDRLIVTAGDNGMYYRDGDERGWIEGISVPVIDVCGAGDTVLAALGVAMAEGAEIREACERANLAASKQVQCLGVAQIKEEVLC